MVSDDERDPHLLAALHHAPDRDAAPTAQLSAAILTEARQALRAPGVAPRASRWRIWQAAFDRLWQPAPMAAFGTLAMAAVIGLMWQGNEPPDATPALRPQRAATPPTSVGTASSERAAAEPSTAASAAKFASPPAAARDRTQAPDGRLRQDGDARAKDAQRSAPTALTARTRRDEQANAQAQPRAEPGAPTQHAQDAALSTAPNEPAAAARANTAAERREALGKTLADPARPPPRASAEALSGRLAAGVAPMPEEPLAPAVAALDAALRSDPARVQWRLTPQRVLAHDAERRAWWSALQGATGGRWQRAAGGSARVGLTLLIDGAPGGSIAFEPQAIIWTDASGSVWRAPLGTGELRALQETQARW